MICIAVSAMQRSQEQEAFERETAASPLLAPGLVANAAHDQDVRVAEGGELDVQARLEAKRKRIAELKERLPMSNLQWFDS